MSILAALRRVLLWTVVTVLVLWFVALLAAIADYAFNAQIGISGRRVNPEHSYVLAVVLALPPIIGIGAWFSALLDVLERRQRGRGWAIGWFLAILIGNVPVALLYYKLHPVRPAPPPPEPPDRELRLFVEAFRRKPWTRPADLLVAARIGKASEVRRLLQSGLTPPQGALRAAARHREAFRLLLEAGASPTDGNPLIEVCRHGDAGQVRLLLEHGADPDAPERGSRPLHEAAARDDPGLAEALVAAGAAIDAPDEFGRTPLHRAARQGTEATVMLLLGAGADPQARDERGRTPLFHAVANPQADVVMQRLIAAGASPAGRDGDANGLVAVAAVDGPHAVDAVVGLGLPVDDPQGNGRTPLWIATMAGAADGVRGLLRHGAAVDRIFQDLTPLMWALADRRFDAATALIEGGADLNAAGPRGCVLDIALGSLDDEWYDRQKPPVDIAFARHLVARGATETERFCRMANGT